MQASCAGVGYCVAGREGLVADAADVAGSVVMVAGGVEPGRVQQRVPVRLVDATAAHDRAAPVPEVDGDDRAGSRGAVTDRIGATRELRPRSRRRAHDQSRRSRPRTRAPSPVTGDPNARSVRDRSRSDDSAPAARDRRAPRRTPTARRSNANRPRASAPVAGSVPGLTAEVRIEHRCGRASRRMSSASTPRPSKYGHRRRGRGSVVDRARSSPSVEVVVVVAAARIGREDVGERSERGSDDPADRLRRGARVGSRLVPGRESKPPSAFWRAARKVVVFAICVRILRAREH